MADIEELLDDTKNMLGLELDDTSPDKRLIWILDSACKRLKILLGGIEPPEELTYIIVEVAIVRFNRIGSEGLESHSVEGESQSFQDSDFDGYMDEIEAYLDEQNGTKKGRVRFL